MPDRKPPLSDTTREDDRRRGPPYGDDFSQSGGGYLHANHKGYPTGTGERAIGRREGDWDRDSPSDPFPGERAASAEPTLGYGSDYGMGGRTGPGGSADYDFEPGDHRGRGPKAYRRSDARLKEDINECLTSDPAIDATDISIECTDGIVTMTGLVDERAMKYRAEDLIASCAGVRDVANRLTVRRSAEH